MVVAWAFHFLERKKNVCCMKSVIDTIFSPIFGWLNQMFNVIMKLTVPASRIQSIQIVF
ncbi:hypothetical protein ACT7DE_19180 [Bacillus paranthracis]